MKMRCFERGALNLRGFGQTFVNARPVDSRENALMGDSMAEGAPGKFASILDDLLGDRTREPDRAHLVSLDHLSVAEELHSGRISIAENLVEAAYRMFAHGPSASANAEKAGNGEGGREEPEPSVDPDEIARELGLAKRIRPRDLDRLRRDFALRNHPDRVPEQLRARAMIRMQVANMLIDDAKSGRFKTRFRKKP